MTFSENTLFFKNLIENDKKQILRLQYNFLKINKQNVKNHVFSLIFVNKLVLS